MDIVLRQDLVEINNISEKKTEITIRKYNPESHNRETRLSDVLKVIPAGLVNKTETGMGATTLELLTLRNSIVVEPIKITASSKAKKHNALYIGTATKFHPQKTTNTQLNKYLKDDAITPKKIVVVADSLKRVISAVGPSVFEDYFLLLDEVDSFQLDSSYRKSMEDCIDYYKQFNPRNRALLSATVLDFSDPDLQEEPVTILKYDVSTKRNIKLFYTNYNNIIPTATIKITELLSAYPNDKIFVAYNSVTGCYNIVNHLIKSNIISQEEVGILCSSNSKDVVGGFYMVLDNEILPKRLNLLTSAYFTGFDINEKYHLVSISGNISRVHALSDHRLKQIAGRCRIPDGLLSETIIHDMVKPNTPKESYNKELLIKEAEKEIAAIQCICMHFMDSEVLKDYYLKISEALLKALEDENRRYIRNVHNENVMPSISYLNIDSTLENTRFRNELYRNPVALTKKLTADGHQVISELFHSNTSVEQLKIDRIDRVEKIRHIIQRLRDPSYSYIVKIRDLEDEYLNRLQKTLVKHFKSLYEYIDPENLLYYFDKYAEMRDSRALNNMIFSANFLTYPDGELFKSRVIYYFPVGCIVNGKDMLDRWNLILTECNIKRHLDKEDKAVRLTTTLLKCTRKKPNSRKIVGMNPYGLTVIKQREDAKDIPTMVPATMVQSSIVSSFPDIESLVNQIVNN